MRRRLVRSLFFLCLASTGLLLVGELTGDRVLPIAVAALEAAESPRESAEEAPGFWSRRLPNPVLASWRGFALTLRLAAVGIAAVSFVLGALTMLALGRRFGVAARPLSPGEVGDLVLNPLAPAVGERVRPVAMDGARGTTATVSYSGDEIAAALADRRYGLVFVALVVAPMLFAVFSTALATAMLVGQEAYLLVASLFVPGGFVATAVVLGIQGIARARERTTAA